MPRRERAGMDAGARHNAGGSSMLAPQDRKGRDGLRAKCCDAGVITRAMRVCRNPFAASEVYCEGQKSRSDFFKISDKDNG